MSSTVSTALILFGFIGLITGFLDRGLFRVTDTNRAGIPARYPSHLFWGLNNLFLALTNSKHLGATNGASSLGSGPPIFHCYLLRIFHLPLGSTFNTIGLHRFLLSWRFPTRLDYSCGKVKIDFATKAQINKGPREFSPRPYS